MRDVFCLSFWVWIITVWLFPAPSVCLQVSQFPFSSQLSKFRYVSEPYSHYLFSSLQTFRLPLFPVIVNRASMNVDEKVSLYRKT